MDQRDYRIPPSNRDRTNRSSQSVTEAQQRATKVKTSSGGGGQLPPTGNNVAAGGDDAPRKSQQAVSELQRQMKEAARQVTRQSAANKATPIASAQKVEAMKKLISRPRSTFEMTPLGSVTRSYRPDQDRNLATEIRRQERSLKRASNQGRIDFNRASRGM